MKKYLILLVFVFLTACSAISTKQASVVATLPIGMYDGQWQGTGNDPAANRNFKLDFTIRNSKITAIQYTFNGKDAIPCSNVDFTSLTPAQQPQLFAFLNIQINNFYTVRFHKFFTAGKCFGFTRKNFFNAKLDNSTGT